MKYYIFIKQLKNTIEYNLWHCMCLKNCIYLKEEAEGAKSRKKYEEKSLEISFFIFSSFLNSRIIRQQWKKEKEMRRRIFFMNWLHFSSEIFLIALEETSFI